jgi:hypothetical protein
VMNLNLSFSEGWKPIIYFKITMLSNPFRQKLRSKDKGAAPRCLPRMEHENNAVNMYMVLFVKYQSLLYWLCKM